MSDPFDSGINELRFAVRLFNDCKESFNERFAPGQLVTLARCYQASDWDYYPDQWTERQVEEALQGFVPDWERDDDIHILPRHHSGQKRVEVTP